MNTSRGLSRVIQGSFLRSQPVFSAAPQARLAQPQAGGQAFQLPASWHLQANAPGRPLPAAIQCQLEKVFATSFAGVSVHVGPQAAALGAQAFTLGSHIYFAPGQYDPQSARGRRLLGHELTHVVQQRTGRVPNPFGSGVAVVQDARLEAEAERMGLRVAALLAQPAPVRPGGPRTMAPGAGGAPIQARRAGPFRGPLALPTGAPASRRGVVQRMMVDDEVKVDPRYTVALKASINGVDIGTIISKTTRYGADVEHDHAEDGAVHYLQALVGDLERTGGRGVQGWTPVDVAVATSLKFDGTKNVLVISALTASPCTAKTTNKAKGEACAEQLIELATKGLDLRIEDTTLTALFDIRIEADHLYQPGSNGAEKEASRAASAAAIKQMQKAGITVKIAK
jgi:hypothetical protein